MGNLKNIKKEMQEFAFEKVDEVYTKNNKIFNEYKSLVEKMGMMIYNNGLISTVANFKANEYNKKGNKKYEYIAISNHINLWLTDKSIYKEFVHNGTSDELLQRLLSIDNGRHLLALTKEAVKLSDALKEMVKARTSIVTNTNNNKSDENRQTDS